MRFVNAEDQLAEKLIDGMLSLRSITASWSELDYCHLELVICPFPVGVVGKFYIGLVYLLHLLHLFVFCLID